MTAPDRPFQIVGGDDLPEYPIARETRLSTHFFFPLHFNRFLNSSLHLLGSYEVQGVAVSLFCLSQNQSPVGTLPRDHALLARLLRMDPAAFAHLCRADIGPLHGWTLCNCEGEIRYMHPVVLEVLGDVISRRATRQASNEARAREKRIERMVAAFADMGVGRDMLADRTALEAIEDHLGVTCHGNRTIAVYERALRWAADQGVLNRRK